MPGVILAYLDQPAAAPTLLRAAAHLADLVGGAEVHALIVRTPPEATIMPSEEVLTPSQGRPHPCTGGSARSRPDRLRSRIGGPRRSIPRIWPIWRRSPATLSHSAVRRRISW